MFHDEEQNVDNAVHWRGFFLKLGSIRTSRIDQFICDSLLIKTL